MLIEPQGSSLRVTGLIELGAANATHFRDKVRAAYAPELGNIEVDLSKTKFIDSCGLGALVALQKLAATRASCIRLLAPPPPVRQILRLTRMDCIFEVVP